MRPTLSILIVRLMLAGTPWVEAQIPEPTERTSFFAAGEVPSKAGSDTCPGTSVGSLPYVDSGTTCGLANALGTFTGFCTFSENFPGEDAIYAITLGESNCVELFLDLSGSTGDLALAVIDTCGNGSSCVNNSFSNFGVGVDEMIPAASYPAGTYHLYIDSEIAAGSSGSCGAYTLSITGLLAPPSFDQSFAPSAIAPGSISTATYTVDNSASSESVGNLSFSSTLPAALKIATPPNATTTCSGGSLNAPAGGSTIDFSSGQVAANGSCTITVDVTSNTPGTHSNVSGELTWGTGSCGVGNIGSGSSGMASATLTVLVAPPGLSMSFDPSAIGFGDTSTLTFTIDNTANAIAIANLFLTTGTLTGIEIANSPNASTTCSGGSLTASAGGSAITYSGGTVPAGSSCVVKVEVTSNILGSHTNTSTLASNAGSSNPATATLTVLDTPAFSKSFDPEVIATGGTSTLTFTIDNSANAATAGGLSFIDTLPAGMTVANPPNASTTCTGGPPTPSPGDSTISYSGGSVAAGTTCVVTVDVTSDIEGSHRNESEPLTSAAGESGTAVARLAVGVPGFSKSFAPDRIPLGGTSTLTFTIDNTPNPEAASMLSFDDNLLNAGMTVASDPNVSNTCGGTLTPGAGDDEINFMDGTVDGNRTCAISVDVTSDTVGLRLNWSGSLTSSLGDSGTARANLRVLGVPEFEKSFDPDRIEPGETTLLTLKIGNDVNDVALGNLAFTDDLDLVGMTIASPPASTDCTGGTLSATVGGTTIEYSGGTVKASDGCEVKVYVTSDTPGIYTNVSSFLTSEAGDSDPATDVLLVGVQLPGFSKSFAPALIAPGGTSTLTFTIDNTANSLMVGDLSFMDKLPTGLMVVGPQTASTTCSAGTPSVDGSTITFSNGKVDAGSSCTVSVDVTGNEPGSYTNVSGDLTSEAGNSGTATAVLSVAVPGLQCAPPPDGLVAWWPFDESAGPSTADVTRNNDGWQNNGPASGSGRVDRALSFDGTDDYVEVPDHPSLSFGLSPAGDFSIVFWVKTASFSDSETVLVDKREPASGSTAAKGYQLTMSDGQLGLRLNETAFQSDVFVANDVWHLVSVTVDRDAPDGVKWYLDGVLTGTELDPTSQPDSLETCAPLRIGRRSFDEATDPEDPGGHFDGILDELQIFDRELTAGEIIGILDAGPLGNCKETVHLRSQTPVCSGAASGVSQLAICNHSTRQRRYTPTFEGLPAADCTGSLDGPTDYELLPSDDPIVIEPRACRTVGVSIGRPAGMTADGLEACYRAEVLNVANGATYERKASLWDSRRWCAEARGDGPIPIPPGERVTATFEVTNTSGTPSSLQYHLAAAPSDPGSNPVSLDDQPAGEIVAGEIQVSAAEQADVSVDVEIQEFRPLEFHDLELGDSQSSTQLASVGVFSRAYGPDALLLNDLRFRIEVEWQVFDGNTGSGQAVPIRSKDSGLFWFFDVNNWEMLVKVLDGCAVNDRFWVFAAATTDVGFTLTVTDTQAGAQKIYSNPVGTAAPAITDTDAFDTCPPGSSEAAGLALPESTGPEVAYSPAAEAPIFTAEKTGAATCTPSPTNLCLNNGRFKVEADWRDFVGNTGSAQVVPVGSGDSGLLWFFTPNNWEMLVKVLDGCAINNHYWVFAAATTNVEYTLRVTDSKNGTVKEFFNPLGNAAAAITNTSAFMTCP